MRPAGEHGKSHCNCADLKTLAETRHLQWMYDLPPSRTAVPCDALHQERVHENLKGARHLLLQAACTFIQERSMRTACM
jgi:hypothetical protein